MKRQKTSNPRIISIRNPDCFRKAAEVIRMGGLVAIPTETYYGIAANPFDELALQKLYEVKKRPLNKPILVLIEKKEQLQELVSEIPKIYELLINKYWPGPLTLVFPAQPEVSSILTGGTSTIGIRLSSDPTATGICKVAGLPITATSANISGMKPASNAYDICLTFGSKIDLIIDGGEADNLLGSTVVGVIKNNLSVLRQGLVELDNSFLSYKG